MRASQLVVPMPVDGRALAMARRGAKLTCEDLALRMADLASTWGHDRATRHLNVGHLCGRLARIEDHGLGWMREYHLRLLAKAVGVHSDRLRGDRLWEMEVQLRDSP